MPKPLSADLRERVMKTYLDTDGLSIVAAAKMFGVGPASLGRWLKRSRERGSVAPDPMGGDHRTIVGEDGLLILRGLAPERPDAVIEDFVELFEERTGVRVSIATMGRALHRAGLSRKKKASAPRDGSPERLSFAGSSGSNSKTS